MEYEQKKILANQISKILTVNFSLAIDYIDRYPYSSLIAESFDDITENGSQSREWLSRTMVALDVDCVNKDNGLFEIIAPQGGALYLLTQKGMFPSNKSMHAIKNRENLIKNLCKQRNYLNNSCLKKNLNSSPKSIFDFVNKDRIRYPFGDDLRLYSLIVGIENLYYEIYRNFESEIRKSQYYLIDDDDNSARYPTPHAAIYQVTDKAYGLLQNSMDNITQVENKNNDDLIDKLLCNICINRVLVEMSVVAEQANLGHKIMIQFVEYINNKNITSIPFFESKSSVDQYFIELFGKGGLLTKKDSIWKPITGGDLEAVYKFAKEAQHQYCASRSGQNFEDDLVCNFLFLLVQAAMFYSNEKVKGEISGEQKYKPMPWRGSPRNADIQRSHALEVTKSAFGIVFFSNSGHQLDANVMKSYSNAIKYKRSHLQRLIFNIKYWNSTDIKNLFSGGIS